MDVYSIVKQYLEANGYDGLVESDYECGCRTNDLAPCGEINGNCIAAYEWPGEQGYDFTMKTEKPEEV